MQGNALDVLDFRRQTREMYYMIREWGTDSPQAHVHFRQTRDRLFHQHPQSSLNAAQKAAFTGLRYYDYDPVFRVVAETDFDVVPEVYETELDEGERFKMRKFGQVSFELPTGAGSLALYWIVLGHGGDMFLPFRDATNDRETYSGGRYLYDTIKGADLGTADGRLVLDFNYAYNPSSAYNPRWASPLAPPENTLDFSVTAGEMRLMI